MDLIIQKNTIKLLKQISDPRNLTSPIIPYRPQKPAFVARAVSPAFPRRAPESAGVRSEHIIDYLNELQSDRSLDMHSVMIIRNGAVISETSFGAYRSDVWRATYSLCKSVTGIAIGMLIDEGRLSLDTPVTKIFERRGFILSALVLKGLTVRHLLTMSSGITFNEAGSVTEEDWIKCFFETSLKFDPGSGFSYNSMNSYMLSAIVRQISGQSLAEYLRERLFEPLGIKNYYWETCPRGIEKGGWGMYLAPEDAAKIGQLYLQGGVWNGKRIISEEWVRESSQNIMKTPERFGDFDYGYHVWVGRNQRKFLFNGMYGQNVLGFFDTNLLVVSNAGNNEMFQQSSFFPITEKYFGAGFSPPESLPRNFAAERRLRKTEAEMGKPRQSFFIKCLESAGALPRPCRLLNGRTYVMDGKIKSASLFPLFAQIIQNSYSKGLRAVSFSIENGIFHIIIMENDETYRIPVGFGAAKQSEISIRGEPYLLGTLGRFNTDDDGNTVLLIRFSFLEIANSRTMRFTFIGDEVSVEFSERPGVQQIKMYISCVETMGRLLHSIFSIVDPDFLDFKLERIFEPVMTGSLDKDKNN